jgi:hypothetical protein
MMRTTTADKVAADLADLKLAADRAGTALACLFSCSTEFEAEVIRARRAQGAYAGASAGLRIRWGTAAMLVLFTFTFLML